MNQITRTSSPTKCLFVFFLISFYVFFSSIDTISTYSSAYSYASILPLLVGFLLAISIVYAVRTTTLAWITVVVLLAFSGKRRRVLAKEGSEITLEVAMCFVKVVVKDKGLVAFAWATVIGMAIMAWFRVADQISYVI
ncbi:hypothetical protein ABFS82_09G014500 [Erythranthe guttata]|uniref:Uncharacterized protein n=1 Tax=Erythranthe guttata TaxID=4155 RepID=A0A022Q2J4_ERYGU|nr:PREDICTED: uncharacterized protein LOC105974915 [Erythranthe guttata]EYU22181.1 hypothetical protein MIMGU_mgv1a016010mg [Erythranthe guttata]|eukprot:XP_012855527.1 PREDICTED: uncharacterized protein LOC105974915 [Erythranthe guttata]